MTGLAKNLTDEYKKDFGLMFYEGPQFWCATHSFEPSRLRSMNKLQKSELTGQVYHLYNSSNCLQLNGQRGCFMPFTVPRSTTLNTCSRGKLPVNKTLAMERGDRWEYRETSASWASTSLY